MRFIARHFRERLRAVLGADEPAGRVAAAWALGVGIALSPFFFLHTVLALLLALLLRLNKPDVLLGTLVMNPWTQPVYFSAAIWLGSALTGVGLAWDAVPAPAELLTRAFWQSGNEFVRSVLLTWGVGSSLIALIGGPLTFVVLRTVILTLRQRHAASALLSERRTGDEAAPTDHVLR